MNKLYTIGVSFVIAAGLGASAYLTQEASKPSEFIVAFILMLVTLFLVLTQGKLLEQEALVHHHIVLVTEMEHAAKLDIRTTLHQFWQGFLHRHNLIVIKKPR